MGTIHKHTSDLVRVVLKCHPANGIMHNWKQTGASQIVAIASMAVSVPSKAELTTMSVRHTINA